MSDQGIWLLLKGCETGTLLYLFGKMKKELQRRKVKFE